MRCIPQALYAVLPLGNRRRVVRHGGIAQHKHAIGPKHTPRLAEERPHISEVMRGDAHGHQVERLVVKGQAFRCRLVPRDIGNVLLLRVPRGLRQHVR